MSYQEFVDKYNGKGIDDDGYYGFQCMDLAHRYAKECVGHDFAPAPAAKDVWNQNIDGYDKIANSPTGVPSKGDIVIWGTAIGAYGHIAVFDHGDANSFTSFDQNWPLNSLCHFQPHNYTGVLGWFHPKSQATSDTIAVPKTDFENLVRKSTEWDKVVALGYTSADAIQKATDTLKMQANEKDEQIDSLNIEVSNLKVQLLTTEDALKVCENKPPSMDAFLGKIKTVVYAKWTFYPGSNYWVKRLHELKALFET